MEVSIVKIDNHKTLMIDGVAIPIVKLEVRSSDDGMTEIDVTIQFSTNLLELSAKSIL